MFDSVLNILVCSKVICKNWNNKDVVIVDWNMLLLLALIGKIIELSTDFRHRKFALGACIIKNYIKNALSKTSVPQGPS